LFIDNIQLFLQENGVLIQISVSIVPGTTVEQLIIFFNQETRRASYV